MLLTVICNERARFFDSRAQPPPPSQSVSWTRPLSPSSMIKIKMLGNGRKKLEFWNEKNRQSGFYFLYFLSLSWGQGDARGTLLKSAKTKACTSLQNTEGKHIDILIYGEKVGEKCKRRQRGCRKQRSPATGPRPALRGPVWTVKM